MIGDHVRVVSWNMNLIGGRSHGERKAAALGALDWDIASLQEVNVAAWDVIRAEPWFEAGVYAFDLTGVPAWKQPNATAIVTRNGYTVQGSALVPGLPVAERGLAGTVVRDRAGFTVCSWHAPNAAQSGPKIKMAGYRAVVDWLATLAAPLVLGFDSNHWSVASSLDLATVGSEPHNEYLEEHQFFGADPPHRLRDALLDVLRREPDRYRSIVAERPGGPLATSYVRHGTHDRFDYVFVSPEFDVVDVRYDYEGGCAAGSDHAFVFADLTLARR